jgi:hypothetical protein
LPEPIRSSTGTPNGRIGRQLVELDLRGRAFGPRRVARRLRWVGDVCRALGASEADLVPFEKYANAALGLSKPSSAARALAAGARDIERVDRLVQTVAAQKGMRFTAVDEIVALVDAWLARNRARDRKMPDATSAAPTT